MTPVPARGAGGGYQDARSSSVKFGKRGADLSSSEVGPSLNPKSSAAIDLSHGTSRVFTHSQGDRTQGNPNTGGESSHVSTYGWQNETQNKGNVNGGGAFLISARSPWTGTQGKCGVQSGGLPPVPAHSAAGIRQRVARPGRDSFECRGTSAARAIKRCQYHRKRRCF